MSDYFFYLGHFLERREIFAYFCLQIQIYYVFNKQNLSYLEFTPGFPPLSLVNPFFATFDNVSCEKGSPNIFILFIAFKIVHFEIIQTIGRLLSPLMMKALEKRLSQLQSFNLIIIPVCTLKSTHCSPRNRILPAALGLTLIIKDRQLRILTGRQTNPHMNGRSNRRLCRNVRNRTVE